MSNGAFHSDMQRVSLTAPVIPYPLLASNHNPSSKNSAISSVPLQLIWSVRASESSGLTSLVEGVEDEGDRDGTNEVHTRLLRERRRADEEETAARSKGKNRRRKGFDEQGGQRPKRKENKDRKSERSAKGPSDQSSELPKDKSSKTRNLETRKRKGKNKGLNSWLLQRS